MIKTNAETCIEHKRSIPLPTFCPFLGLFPTQANYTDPQSKLRFSTIEEFSYIRRLPSDVVTGYLALRKATSIVP